MADDRQLVPKEPEPRRVTATPDDVIGPGEKRKRKRQRPSKYADQFVTVEISSLDTPVYVDWSNLRTPEADRPDPEQYRAFAIEEESAKRSILGEIERTEDPALRRALLEEYHRGDH